MKTKIEFILSLGLSLDTILPTELILVNAAWELLNKQNLENKELKMENERLSAQIKSLSTKKKDKKSKFPITAETADVKTIGDKVADKVAKKVKASKNEVKDSMPNLIS
jgi:hypothetical protein